jgi:hypothetical protein
MKKSILSIVILLILCFNAFGAGSSFTVSSDSVINGVRTVTTIFTADDATGAIPSLTINKNTAGISQGPFDGYVFWKVDIDCNHAGTEPTEDSDLVVLHNGVDLLDTGGTDMIDNTAERSLYASVNSGGFIPIPIISDMIATITQAAAATNSATGTLKFIFIKLKS